MHWILPMCVLATLLFAAPSAKGQLEVKAWDRDFAMQPVGKRPMLEARYEDAARRACVIEGATYRLTFDLQSEKGQRIRSLVVKTAKEEQECLNAEGGAMDMMIEGQLYGTASSRTPSRVNIYRRGPYYIQVHWLDVQWTGDGEKVAPLRGEVVFHAYPEKVYIEALPHVRQPVKTSHAVLSLTSRWKSNTLTSLGEVILRSPGGAGIALFSRESRPVVIAPESALVSTSVSFDWPSSASPDWQPGKRYPLRFVILPLPDARNAKTALAIEQTPLSPSAFKVAKGSTVRFDADRGCYVIGTHNDGGFTEHFYQHPNAYETAAFTVKNDGRPRKVYICHETATGQKGSVECGVLQDGSGNTLPITVQISKNFAGENEEPFYNPGDPAFSETYFPLYLAPDETRAVTSHHLYQNWGNHPLKQFSSLGAWMDYYHMSTGVTETTCYVPFKFDGLHGVQIADMRPFSQKFWASQPQHDNVAGHTFLRYVEDGKLRDMEYTGTTFRSTGPNWADMSLHFRSEDGKIVGRLDGMEMPQTDELRSFVHLRFDVKAPITLADMAKDFRLLSIRSYVQRLRYQKVAWAGETGEEAASDIAFDGQVYAQPMRGSYPWACIYQDNRGNNAYVLRRWKARLTGKEGVVPPGVAVQGEANGNTTLMLVPYAPGPATLQPGDYVECDLFLLPYGPIGTENPVATPKAESERYGARAPQVMSVARGKKRADFPPRVDADAKGVAEFTVQGGKGALCLLVGNLPSYARPRLYRRDGSRWVPVSHSVKGEDGYQTFVDAKGKFGAVFLTDTGDGKPQTYRALNLTLGPSPSQGEGRLRGSKTPSPAAGKGGRG